jgi:hypothetical protein
MICRNHDRTSLAVSRTKSHALFVFLDGYHRNQKQEKRGTPMRETASDGDIDAPEKYAKPKHEVPL